MPLREVVVGGTLKPDGTLDLDEKPCLSPGRVTVILRHEVAGVAPPDDPFWQRMQTLWGLAKAPGSQPGGGTPPEVEVRRMRAGWHEHQQALERLQEESQRLREAEGAPQ